MNSGLKKGLVLGGLIGGALLALSKTKQGKVITKKAHQELADLYAKMGSQMVELGDATRETYEDAVETMVELYAKNKQISSKTQAYLVGELKERWQHIQVRALYVDLKKKLAGAATLSRKTFDKAADDLAKEYGQEKALTKKAVGELARTLKEHWAEFKAEMAE